MKYGVLAVFSFLLVGCSAVSLETQRSDMDKASGGGNNMTIASVQRGIKIGMSSADVAGILGSPNMVTTDDQRRESWVYDKVSTDNFVSGSTGFFFGQGTGNATSSRTQKTLTIIIKFDENGKVRDFAYNQTKF